MIRIKTRRAAPCDLLRMVEQSVRHFTVETPAELRQLAANYRGLAEIGAADYKAGRLRLAAYLERLAAEREAAGTGDGKDSA